MKKCVSRRRCYPKAIFFLFTLIEPNAIVDFNFIPEIFYLKNQFLIEDDAKVRTSPHMTMD
jgi:hypothetical protein